MVEVLQLRQVRQGDALIALVRSLCPGQTTTQASKAAQLPSHGKPSYSFKQE